MMTEVARKNCTRCGKEENRENVIVMKVAFHRLGEPSSQVRSRNVDWLCPECLGASDEWNIPSRSKTKTSGLEVPCDTCGGLFSRAEIMVSKVTFYPLGKAGLTLRSRTRSWQCFRVLESGEVDPSCCVSKDVIWNREGYRSTPAWRETAGQDSGESAGA